MRSFFAKAKTAIYVDELTEELPATPTSPPRCGLSP